MGGPPFDIADIRALTFDCYGTLIDWETGLLAVLRPWADREGIGDLDDDALLRAYSGIEPVVQSEHPATPYPAILREVMRRLGARFGAVATHEDGDALARSVGDWPAFADTPAALSRLKKRFTLVIVSNVDRASFERSNTRLGVEFDAIVTAEDVGGYKPSLAHFHRALEILNGAGIAGSQVLHVAESLYHDHVPAKSLGLATAWIKRSVHGSSRATRSPGSPIEPDMRFPTLAALADAILR